MDDRHGAVEGPLIGPYEPGTVKPWGFVSAEAAGCETIAAAVRDGRAAEASADVTAGWMLRGEHQAQRSLLGSSLPQPTGVEVEVA